MLLEFFHTFQKRLIAICNWKKQNTLFLEEFQITGFLQILLITILLNLLYSILHQIFQEKILWLPLQKMLIIKDLMALIYLTDQIRNDIDRGNYASRIFSYFPKAFDDHMQMEKIEYFVFREISNYWFVSYLSKRKLLRFRWIVKSSRYQMWGASRLHTVTPFVSYPHKWFTSSNQVFWSAPLYGWY